MSSVYWESNSCPVKELQGLSTSDPALQPRLIPLYPYDETSPSHRTEFTTQHKNMARSKSMPGGRNRTKRECVTVTQPLQSFRRCKLVTVTGHGPPGRQNGNGRAAPPRVKGYCEQFRVSIVAMASGVYTNMKITTLCVLNVRR